MTLYKNKYRIESARHPNRDYSSNGWYFITICTHNRQHFFGTIQNGTMQLSSIGQIVAEEWQKTAMIRPYVVLDEWVVMPNHFHAIVGIQNTGRLELPDSPDDTVETFRRNYRGFAFATKIIGVDRRTIQIHMHQTDMGKRMPRIRMATPISRPHHPKPHCLRSHPPLHPNQSQTLENR